MTLDEKDEELEKIRRDKLKKMMTNPPKSESPKPTSGSGGDVVLLNASDFWDKIKANEKALIDCYADWCGPCKMIEPIFAQLAQAHKDIFFGRINVDFAHTIASTFQIQAIPLILFFKQGNLVNRLLGANPYNVIEDHIQKHLT